MFGILSSVLGQHAWPTSDMYSTNAARVKNRVELEAAIEAITSQQPVEHWLAAFEGKGMPYGPVNDVKATLEHPHTQARNMVVEMEHPECGTMKLLNSPVKWSEATPGVRAPPPVLGQHTGEILGGLLGLDEGAIGELKSQGVVA